MGTSSSRKTRRKNLNPLMGKKAQLADLKQASMTALIPLEKDWNPDGVNHGYTYLDLYDVLMTSYLPKIIQLQKEIVFMEERPKRLVDQGEV